MLHHPTDNDDDDDNNSSNSSNSSTMNSIHNFWTSGDIGTSSADPYHDNDDDNSGGDNITILIYLMRKKYPH